MFFWDRCPLIVFLAIVQHFFWAAMLLWNEQVEQVTALAALSPFVILYRGVVPLITVAIMAAASIFIQSRIWRTAMMLPQQFILGVSAMGALEAMYNSTFADGVWRPRAFLIADQIPVVLIAVFHTIAIIRSARNKNWEKDTV